MTTNLPPAGAGDAPEPERPATGEGAAYGYPGEYAHPGEYAYPSEYTYPDAYRRPYQYSTDYRYPTAYEYPGYYGAAHGSDYGYPPFAAPGLEGYPPPPARRRGWRLGAGVATLTAAALVGGIAIGDAVSGSSTVAGSGSDAQLAPGPGSGQLPGGGSEPGSGGSRSGNGNSTSVTLANAKQKTGVVTIVSTLRYRNSQSAGTGMLLSSDGEVLTNNHVVNGATSIVVTVSSSGRSYRADVVGTDPSDDVAVIRLRNASGLKTANLAANSQGVKTGDSVVGVGNAGGTGTLRASSGTVTALDQSITASDGGTGADAERLTGLIQTNAPIISGDSGGPLYDAAGKVIGMDTAASSNPGQSEAYAIPIEDAVSIARQIETGRETAKIHIGLPAFLGVSIGNTAANGALVESLLDGGPAASAGITPGSTITRVDSTVVTSGAGLKTALRKYEPGDRAKITWTDAAGRSHSAIVRLATGPVD